MARQYFTVEEAEQRIPSISPLLRRARDVKTRLERYEGRTVRQRIMTDGSEEELMEGSFDGQLQDLKELFYTTVERIERQGCIVRSVDEGMVDFYTQFEGREVFLSWRIGDEKITYWHELEDVENINTIVDLG